MGVLVNTASNSSDEGPIVVTDSLTTALFIAPLPDLVIFPPPPLIRPS